MRTSFPSPSSIFGIGGLAKGMPRKNPASSCSSSRRPMVRTPVIAMLSVSFGSVFMCRDYAASPGPDHRQAAARLFGTLGSRANSPASTRRMNSASAVLVMYCLPLMFTVASHPLRRQRHAVTSEIPASSQNLRRLKKGLPSMVNCGVVFTPQVYEAPFSLEDQ